MTNRYRHTDLIDATTALFQQAGLEPPIARAVAETLVEADLLGYSTHGLQFVPAYLARIEKGTTRTNGEPELVHENGANLVFDAGQLPGQWAVRAVLDDALTRLPTRGVVTAVIRQCGNISCLATYVKQAADTGIMALLASSSPGNAAVAPHGGKTARYSTNPMAIGIPATPHPILIDTSTASSSNRQIERAARANRRLAAPALIDAEGRPSDDPADFIGDSPGAILPMGGAELGHRGFGFAIMVEALTSALAGKGRAEGAGASNVFLQLIDPKAFGGSEAFLRETAAFAEHCRAAEPIDPAAPVRMPGDRAYAQYAEQIRGGVALHPEIPDLIAPCFERYGVDLPAPVT